MNPEMTTLAARWAGLWGQDPVRAVEEIYSPDVVVERAGHGRRGCVVGREALHRVEDERLRTIPDYAIEILRIVTEGDKAVIECLLTGTAKDDDRLQACPACIWWWFDTSGRVAHEVAYWEWAKRRPHDGSVAGTLVAGDGQPRPWGRARTLAQDLAAQWSTDPVGMVDRMYAEDCVIERLGEGPGAVMRGAEAGRNAQRALAERLPPPWRRMVITDVVGEDDVVAIAFSLEARARGRGPLQRGPGTLLLTLGSQDRIVSERSYWHWSRARPVAEAAT